MAKIKNRHVYGTPEKIKFLKEECDYIARNVCRIDPDNPGHLIIFALPPKKRAKKEDVKKEEAKRKARHRNNGFNRFKEMSNNDG